VPEPFQQGLGKRFLRPRGGLTAGCKINPDGQQGGNLPDQTFGQTRLAFDFVCSDRLAGAVITGELAEQADPGAEDVHHRRLGC
jgi:hypothetical protein